MPNPQHHFSIPGTAFALPVSRGPRFPALVKLILVVVGLGAIMAGGFFYLIGAPADTALVPQETLEPLPPPFDISTLKTPPFSTLQQFGSRPEVVPPPGHSPLKP